MSTVVIEHTAAEGTTLCGLTKPETRRGQPARAVLDRYTWFWGSVKGWHQRSSFDQPPRRWRIDGTAAALRELGYTVAVEVDATPRPVAEREADREQRADDRVERAEAAADRRSREAAARRAPAERFFEHLPFGQPVMGVRDANRRAKHLNSLSAAHELDDKAAYRSQRAQTAAAYIDGRNHPRAVLSRVERLGDELRKLEKQRSESPESEHWRQRVDDVAMQLEHWQKVHAQHVADGLIQVFGKHNVRRGQWVTISGLSQYRVAKANPKTVEVYTRPAADGSGRWLSLKVPWRKVLAVADRRRK